MSIHARGYIWEFVSDSKNYIAKPMNRQVAKLLLMQSNDDR